MWLTYVALAPHMLALTCKCSCQQSRVEGYRQMWSACHSLGGLDSSDKSCRHRSVGAQQEGSSQHQPCAQSAGKGRRVRMIDCLRVPEGPIADGALVAVAVEVLGAGASPGLLTANDRGECCWQRGTPPEMPAAILDDESSTGLPRSNLQGGGGADGSLPTKPACLSPASPAALPAIRRPRG